MNMMQWALAESDRLDYDIHVEVSHNGAYLYSRFGSLLTGQVFNPTKPQASEKWREIEKQWSLRFTRM